MKPHQKPPALSILHFVVLVGTYSKDKEDIIIHPDFTIVITCLILGTFLTIQRAIIFACCVAYSV